MDGPSLKIFIPILQQCFGIAKRILHCRSLRPLRSGNQHIDSRRIKRISNDHLRQAGRWDLKGDGCSFFLQRFEKGWRIRMAERTYRIRVMTIGEIRALGFMGIMVQAGHHQMHHLAVTKGEMMHTH